MKRLICCLDGTWNDDRKASERTNVAKLHRSILVTDGSGRRQISHYVEGIATTQGQSAQFLRGAIGLEVEDRIRQGYTFLCEHYEAGDEIFLFGFSRGAFEARSLASFVSIFGIPRKDAAFTFDEAWTLYRTKERRRDLDALMRLSAECYYPVRIRCVGVWDTVGNIGNPLLPNGIISRRLKFHDMRLHDTIDVALQALSIDEQRAPFSPTLWTLPEGAVLPHNQQVEQVWFAGTHADVGGGWPETALSDVALLWMAERAIATTGLGIDLERLRSTTKPDPLGLQHDSTGARVFVLDRLIPFIRLIKQQTRGAVPALRRLFLGLRRTGKLRGQTSINESIHDSVKERIGRAVSVATLEGIHDTTYMPRNLVAAIGPPDVIEKPIPKPAPPIVVAEPSRPLELRTDSKPEATAVASAMASAMASSAAYVPVSKPPPKDPEPERVAPASAPANATAPAFISPAPITAKTPQQPISPRQQSPAMTNEKPELAEAGPGTEGAGPPPRIRIVTVHGTGAGAEADTGNSWWQKNSPFQVKLAEQVALAGDNVEVVPFHWGTGPNSETARRNAGKKLCDLLRGYDADGIAYVLIGHSHGGSVIYNALLHSAGTRQPLEGLKSWFTVGTPFLDYKPSSFLFARLNIWGQLIYVTGAAALLFALGLLASKFFSLPLGQLVTTSFGEKADQVFYAPLIALLSAYVVLCYLALYVTERFTKHWSSDKQKAHVRDLYEKKWVGFWHHDDEAIAALANVGGLKRKIVPSNFLVPVFSMLPLLATIGGVIFLFLGAANNLRADNPKIAEAFQKMGQVEVKGDNAWDIMTLARTVFEVLQFVVVIAAPLLGIYLIVTSIALLVSKLLAHIVGTPLSSAIDGLVWSSVRQQAWGNDRRGEHVRKVSNHPPLFDTRYVALPGPVASKIAGLSESQAAETLRRAREILGMTVGAEPTGDIGRDLSAQLTWKELIHTCYFEIDEFISVLARGLSRSGLPVAASAGSPSKDVDTWLSEINAPGQQSWWAQA